MKNIKTRLIVGSLKVIKYLILLVWCLTIIFVLWYYKVIDRLFDGTSRIGNDPCDLTNRNKQRNQFIF